jgi:hypothetical protein
VYESSPNRQLRFNSVRSCAEFFAGARSRCDQCRHGDQCNVRGSAGGERPGSAQSVLGDQASARPPGAGVVPVTIRTTCNYRRMSQVRRNVILPVMLDVLEDNELLVYGDGFDIPDWPLMEDHVVVTVGVVKHCGVGMAHAIATHLPPAALQAVPALSAHLNRHVPGPSASQEQPIRFVTGHPNTSSATKSPRVGPRQRRRDRRGTPSRPVRDARPTSISRSRPAAIGMAGTLCRPETMRSIGRFRLMPFFSVRASCKRTLTSTSVGSQAISTRGSALTCNLAPTHPTTGNGAGVYPSGSPFSKALCCAWGAVYSRPTAR